MSGEPAPTAAIGRHVLPAYIGLALLGFVLALLAVVVLTEAGAPDRQADLVGGAVFAVSVLPYAAYVVLTLTGGDANE